MGWQQILNQSNSSWPSSWEGVWRCATTWYDSAEGILSESLRWLRDRTSDVFAWFSDISRKVTNSDLADLTGVEIAICFLLLLIGVRLSLRLLDAIRLHAEANDSPSNKSVLLEGRWTVHGYENPFAAEERRRRWKSKLMSPAEQQHYVDQVKSGKMAQSDSSSADKQAKSKFLRLILLSVTAYGVLLYIAPNYSESNKADTRPAFAKSSAAAPAPALAQASKSTKLAAHPVRAKPSGNALAEEAVIRKPMNSTADPVNNSWKVVRVIDGDLIVVRNEEDEIELKLFGIDSPELKQPHGKHARKALQKWVGGKVVVVRAKNAAGNGHLAGVVYYQGKNINSKMVCAGLAWWSKDSAPDEPELAKCQRSASTLIVGLWSDSNPEPPWEWRKRNQ